MQQHTAQKARKIFHNINDLDQFVTAYFQAEFAGDEYPENRDLFWGTPGPDQATDDDDDDDDIFDSAEEDLEDLAEEQFITEQLPVDTTLLVPADMPKDLDDVRRNLFVRHQHAPGVPSSLRHICTTVRHSVCERPARPHCYWCQPRASNESSRSLVGGSLEFSILHGKTSTNKTTEAPLNLTVSTTDGLAILNLDFVARTYHWDEQTYTPFVSTVNLSKFLPVDPKHHGTFPGLRIAQIGTLSFDINSLEVDASGDNQNLTNVKFSYDLSFLKKNEKTLLKYMNEGSIISFHVVNLNSVFYVYGDFKISFKLTKFFPVSPAHKYERLFNDRVPNTFQFQQWGPHSSQRHFNLIRYAEPIRFNPDGLKLAKCPNCTRNALQNVLKNSTVYMPLVSYHRLMASLRPAQDHEDNSVVC